MASVTSGSFRLIVDFRAFTFKINKCFTSDNEKENID